MKRPLKILAVCFVAVIAISACKKKSDDSSSSNPSPSLYDQVGGTALKADTNGAPIETGRYTLRAVVDSSIYVIAADNHMTPYFGVLLGEVGAGNKTGFHNLSKNLTDFLCVATGGKDYSYSGLSMQNAHNPSVNTRIGKFVTYADFDSFVGDVGTGLAKNGVTAANNASLVNSLVALLYTTRTDVTNLYTRVGGTTLTTDVKNGGQIETGRYTLRAVVDSSIYVIAADNQLNPYFATLLSEVGANNFTGFNALSKNLTDFLCVATGSKNSAYAYNGRSMKDAHNPATNARIAEKVTSADFDKFVGDIGTGLAKNGVTASNSPDLVNDLVALLYTTKTDIVQR